MTRAETFSGTKFIIQLESFKVLTIQARFRGRNKVLKIFERISQKVGSRLGQNGGKTCETSRRKSGDVHWSIDIDAFRGYLTAPASLASGQRVVTRNFRCSVLVSVQATVTNRGSVSGTWQLREREMRCISRSKLLGKEIRTFAAWFTRRNFSITASFQRPRGSRFVAG